MTSSEIRKQFLDFFASKQHQIVPSAPIVVKDDPTLMFINSGMAPFKDLFLGNKPIQFKRVADTQKCLRVSGKHNDLEEVGHDTYHHTMFEMLGNWSFGDYFKKEAIAWAWELLTEVYKLPKDRLYVTVFEGDKTDNLASDQEALEIWKQFITEDRILYGNKKDNFWEMGDTGPCGPCTEIHIDLRSEEEVTVKPGKELVNNDHPQVVEIWNNVFMEFNRLADGSLVKLPAQHVDTGMGFERLCMAIQGKRSNYDTDVFQPMIQFIAKAAGINYGADEKQDIAIRVIADHIRAISFTIADGQLPSNNKAGYVIRRILRRAVRYGFTFLDFKKPFLNTLVPVLADQFADVFPELKAQQDFVAKVIEEEETAFLRTLDNGLKRIESQLENFRSQGNLIDGRIAFELYDTFGFPLDLTALIAREQGLTVDEVGFGKEMEQQKARSKKDAAKETSDWVEIQPGAGSEFVGYDQHQAEAQVVKYREVAAKNKKLYQVVLDHTPFYAESGGQVGDTGTLSINGEKIKVLDTKKENDLTIHLVDKLPDNLQGPVLGAIDSNRRLQIQNNHSATHLLHAALRQFLGTHVQQKGSLVNEEVLRFDFSHFSKVTDEQIEEIERIVNRKIRENIRLEEMRNVPIEEAKNFGAMALFGEKYGDNVRVIAFDRNYSVELCGGCHVPATGVIGFFKITSESSVAAGVRRIEAVTAEAAEEFVRTHTNQLQQIKQILNSNDPVKSVEQLQAELSTLRKKLEIAGQKQMQAQLQEMTEKIESRNGYKFLAAMADADNADQIKQLAFDARRKVGDDLVLVLGSIINEKPFLAVMLSDNIAQAGKLNSVAMIKELAREIQGGGGGQPFYATAGGKDVNGLQRALEKAKEIIG